MRGGALAALRVENPANGDGMAGYSSDRYGVAGNSNNSYGVYGFSQNLYGVMGNSNRNTGVVGFSNRGTGVVGYSYTGSGVAGSSNTAAGVVGYSNTAPGMVGSSDAASGVEGVSENYTGVVGLSGNLYGVEGNSNTSYGVYGNSYNSVGVVGNTDGDSNTFAGVLGTATRAETGVQGESANSTGVLGLGGTSPTATTSLRSGPGVLGIGPPRFGGWAGVDGRDAINGGIGIHGRGFFAVRGTPRGTPINGQGPWAGWFEGQVSVNGALKKPGGGFWIDHPLEPANKYLNHSFVESDEMKNLYDGVIDLDEEGTAWVGRPVWFNEVNGDIRYQLTAVGEPAPELHIAQELSLENNGFRIAGGKKGMKVCWQVTGIRKDPWAKANPIEVEQEELGDDRGRYLHPELYDAPEESGINPPVRDEEPMQQMEELRWHTQERRPSRPPVVPSVPPPGTDFVRGQLPPQPPAPSSIEFTGQEAAGYWRQMERQIEEFRRQMEEQLQLLEELRQRTEEGQREENPPRLHSDGASCPSFCAAPGPII